MSCWRGAACLVIAGAFVPCTARCAEPPRLLAERISVSLTESPAPAKLGGRSRDPFLLTSELAPAVLQGAKDVPQLWLAQRSIDRQWGASDDSTYKTIDIPGYKSEGWAMMMSAVVRRLRTMP